MHRSSGIMTRADMLAYLYRHFTDTHAEASWLLAEADEFGSAYVDDFRELHHYEADCYQLHSTVPLED